MKPLAIVLPAHKARFLDATLASIAAQTLHEFTLYVGDDASPEGLGAICARWAGCFDLRYTRFERNLGATDLVAQWHRCIALSSEPWVWLFSDDDLMPTDAVERLLATVRAEGGRHVLFHFNVDRIDAEDRLIAAEPAFPERLSVREFARRRLRFELSSYAPDYAFSRAAFERLGGFVPFPRAWCSDDATWVSLGAAGGIRTVAGARVGWRSSGDNISSRHGPDAPEKLRAVVAYLGWIDRFLRVHPAAPGEPDDEAVMREASRWFVRQARFLDLTIDPALARFAIDGLAGVRGFSALGVRAAIWRLNLRRRWHSARGVIRGARAP